MKLMRVCDLSGSFVRHLLLSILPLIVDSCVVNVSFHSSHLLVGQTTIITCSTRGFLSRYYLLQCVIYIMYSCISPVMLPLPPPSLQECECLRHLGQHDNAIKSCENAIRLDNNFMDAYTALGEVYMVGHFPVVCGQKRMTLSQYFDPTFFSQLRSMMML